MISSRLIFGPFGRDPCCEIYSGRSLTSDTSREIGALRVSRFKAGSYRIRGVELKYKGDSDFTTCFGAPVDDDTLDASSLTLEASEFFVYVSLGFFVDHLCSFSATTNFGRCVLLDCGGHLDHFGVVQAYEVHNNGARLKGICGRASSHFICSLSLCFDNSWHVRRPFVLLRHQRRDVDDILLRRLLYLPDVIHRIVLLFL